MVLGIKSRRRRFLRRWGWFGRVSTTTLVYGKVRTFGVAVEAGFDLIQLPDDGQFDSLGPARTIGSRVARLQPVEQRLKMILVGSPPIQGVAINALANLV
jgi:hypothetical protein